MSVVKRRPITAPKSLARMLQAALFCTIMLLGIFVALDLTSQEAEAAGGSNLAIWVELDESYAYVNVKPGTIPQTSFKGKVWVSGDTGSGRIDLSLKAHTDRSGFLSSVTPMQVSINSIAGRAVYAVITLNVIAPLRANYTDGLRYPPVQVTVDGDWLSFPSGLTGQISNSTVMLTVNQFYDLTVYIEPPHFKGLPGDSAWFDIWIKNMGNGIDEFEVSIVNDLWYADMGFSFWAETWQIDIAPNSEGKIRLRVDSPASFSIYESSVYSITIKITSKGSWKYESSVNPRNTIYDISFHCKGPGAVQYFSAEFLVLLLTFLIVMIFVLFNTKVFVSGMRKKTKMPVRTYWSRKFEKMDERSKERRARAEVRNKEKEIIKAEKRKKREAVNAIKRAEREKLAEERRIVREAEREEKRKLKDAQNEEKRRIKEAEREEKMKQKEAEAEEKRKIKEAEKEEKRRIKEAIKEEKRLLKEQAQEG